MRAVRDCASRAGKSRPALLGSRTALINPDFSVKMSDVSEHSEFCYPEKKKGKKKGKARWSYDKMLID